MLEDEAKDNSLKQRIKFFASRPANPNTQANLSSKTSLGNQLVLIIDALTNLLHYITSRSL